MNVLTWNIDAYYVIRHNIKGRTRASISMGFITLHAKYIKQNLNFKSISESKPMGLDDCMTQVLWRTYFIEDQGYKIDDSIIYQYKKRAMLLEKNGTLCRNKRTNHINVRYCFISNKVTKGQARLYHCPTR